MRSIQDAITAFWTGLLPDAPVRTIQDQLDAFWAQLPADARYTPEEWAQLEAEWLGQHLPEPDACAEHRSGCPTGAHG